MLAKDIIRVDTYNKSKLNLNLPHENNKKNKNKMDVSNRDAKRLNMSEYA